MEQRLSGKVAIITGSGQGIGKGIAQRLAREGAHVVIAEYNAESAAAAARGDRGRRAAGRWPTASTSPTWRRCSGWWTTSPRSSGTSTSW